MFLDEDEPNNLVSYFTYGLLKEQYNVTPYLNPQLGAVSNVADYKSVRNTTIVNKNDVFDRENSLISSIELINTVERMNIYDQTKRDAFIEYSSKLPVHRRVNVEELNFLLNRELLDKDIETDYEFGVYNDGLATKIISNNYVDELNGPRYSTPIFMNSEGVGMYDLVVTFPQKDTFVLSSIFGIGALTVLLTLFIVLVSTSALYQIISQKKLSEIKTEFINNKVTGNTIGEPNFESGKLINVKKWCIEKKFNLEEATFYTDSIHDLPLVEKCKNSILVSPDERLKKLGENKNLKIIQR